MTEPRAAIVELTLARFRMFFREPSAVFWTFGFPVLLSIALGAAFRNRPPEAVHVAIQAGPGAERLLEALNGHAAGGEPSQSGKPPRSRPAEEVKATIEDPETAHKDLRIGKVVLIVIPGETRAYRYDDTRPTARLARAMVDDRLQRAEGRIDPTPSVDEHVTEAGTRYIDFLIPGLIGMNLMSSSMWGIGYLIVDMRTRKLISRMLATPMRRGDFLLSFVLMRSLFVLLEVPSSPRVRLARVRGEGHRLARPGSLSLRARSAHVRRARAARGVARREHADGRRTDEPGHDADVHRLGSLLLRRPISRTPCSPPSALSRSRSSTMRFARS